MRARDDVLKDKEDSGTSFFRALPIALLLSLLLWLIIIAGYSYGRSTIVGHDFLALQHPKFPYKKVLPYIKHPSALGLLDYTFGTDLAPVSYMLASGKFSYLRVHLINGSCIRQRNCGSYYLFKKYTPATFNTAVLREDPKITAFIKDRILAYCSLASLYPDVKLLISPVLEHNLSKAAWKKLANTVRLACPAAQLVNSPMSDVSYKGVLNEQHKPPADFKADIVSMDGWDIASFMLKEIYFSGYKVFFIWDGHYNCRDAGPFIDPRKRTSCPKPSEVRYLEYLFTGRR